MGGGGWEPAGAGLHLVGFRVPTVLAKPCVFVFWEEKFMTFDQSLKEFQRLRTTELAQPPHSEMRKQVQRGTDSAPRFHRWLENPDH